MNPEHRLEQAILRAWPFPRGAGRIADKFFRHLRFREERATVLTTDGVELTVMPNELIGRHIYLTGEFDRTTVEILCNFSEPGDVLLDVGANVGYVAACFLKNVEKSRVVAVEPQPGIVDLLQQNLEAFGDRQMVYPYALSDKDQTVFFNIDEENRGSSGIGSSGTQIEARATETMLADLGISRIDLMKVDVEGHEIQVFNSAKEAVRRLHPRAILFEDHQGAQRHGIGEMLTRLGYEIRGIKKHLTKVELLTNYFDTNDYVAISKSRQIPTLARKLYRESGRKS